MTAALLATFVVALVAYIVLMRWVLPRFGIET